LALHGATAVYTVPGVNVPVMASTELAAESVAYSEPLAQLELELEHPAVPSRPAATTAAPSKVAVRGLKISTKRFVRDPSDARLSGVKRAPERPTSRKEPKSTHLINARLSWRRTCLT
jgi:hypothetical protein